LHVKERDFKIIHRKQILRVPSCCVGLSINEVRFVFRRLGAILKVAVDDVSSPVILNLTLKNLIPGVVLATLLKTEFCSCESIIVSGVNI